MFYAGLKITLFFSSKEPRFSDICMFENSIVNSFHGTHFRSVFIFSCSMIIQFWMFYVGLEKQNYFPDFFFLQGAQQNQLRVGRQDRSSHLGISSILQLLVSCTPVFSRDFFRSRNVGCAQTRPDKITQKHTSFKLIVG